MSASSRLSLHDCKVQIRIPLLSAEEKKDAPDLQTLHAVSKNKRDLSEAYIGSSIFVVVTVSPPNPSHASSTLIHALEALGDLQVFLAESGVATSKRKDQSAVRLPILRESAWCPGPGLIAKGLWALVRSPPSSTDADRVLAAAGRHDVMITLRERSVPVAARNSPVWATIDRAGRLFAKSVVMRAIRPIMLAMPIQISCHTLNVSGSADRIIVSVSARNATAEAYLSVMPPYINVGSSRLVNENDREGVDGIPVQLDGQYDILPLSNIGGNSDDDFDRKVEDTTKLSREESDGRDDYGLLIPSFNSLMRDAVSLGPREIYNFAYTVSKKAVSDATEDLSEETNVDAAQMSDSWRVPSGKCLRTNVAIAWSCSLSKDGEDNIDESSPNLSREMSAGGVLATGRRGNVAVHIAYVDWKPPGLMEGVIVKFAGPRSAAVGNTIHVSMSILNQTERHLGKVCVRLQQDAKSHGLLALRTVIIVGGIARGMETSLQLPCIPVQSGKLGLGTVEIVTEDDDAITTWTTESEYQLLGFESFEEADSSAHEEVDIEAIAEMVAR